MRISERFTLIILLTGSALLLFGLVTLRLTGENFQNKPIVGLLIIWAVVNIIRAILELRRLSKAKKTEINTADIK